MKDIIVIAILVAINFLLFNNVSWQAVAVIVGVTFVAYRKLSG